MTAYEVAAALYDRSCALAEVEGAEYGTLHELLCAAGDAWYSVGDIDQASTRFDRAAEIARANRDGERLIVAAINAAAALRHALLYDRALKRHVQDGLALLPPGDSALRAGALAVGAITMRTLASAEERDELSQQAIDMVRRLGDEAALQWTLNARHLALWGAVHPRDLLPITAEMVQLGRKTGDHELLMDALMWRVSDFSELGDLESARRAREEYGIEVETVGSPWHRYMLLTCESLEANTVGDFARASELSERARQLGVRLRDPLAQAFYTVRALFRRFDDGFVHGRASGELPEWLRDPPSSVPDDHRAFWTLSWALHGRRFEAASAVAQVLALERSRLLVDSLRRPLLSVMAEVSALLEDREQATSLYPLLLPAAGLHSHLHAGVNLGPVSHYLGRLAGCLGQTDTARAHYEQALVENGIGRPGRARTLLGLGAVLATQPSAAARARAALREARDLAGSLGMADVRAAAERQLDETAA